MEGCFGAIKSFQGENNYSAVILMGLKVENGIVQRDIAICGKNDTREVWFYIFLCIIQNTAYKKNTYSLS